MAAELGSVVVSGVASSVTESVFGLVRRKGSYVFNYQSYIQDLKKKTVEELISRRERVEVYVDHAKRQGEEIFKDVEQWLINVDEFIKRAENIMNKEDKAKKCCLKGPCPSLVRRYMLSREAVKAEKDGAVLLGKADFSNVSYRLRRKESINVSDYEAFISRMSKFQEIMETLKDANFNLIGVSGMGGVGKTTLVKKIACQALEDKLFDRVVIAEVTLTPDHKKIQDKIAYDLDMQFGQESEFERAGRLRDRLKKENRVLVILDNIWEKLDLKAIGIPFGHVGKESLKPIGFPSSHDGQENDKPRIPFECDKHDDKEKSNDQRRCKILMTSRNQQALDDMKTQKTIRIEILSSEEAQNLFGKIVGDLVEKPDFQSVAIEIAKKCAGLPLAIATIGNALKNKTIYEWRDVLDTLRRSNLRWIHGMDGTLYSTLKLSYNYLNSEEAKLLFQLCGLLSKGYPIPTEFLLTCGMGMGLFQDVHTVETGKNRVRVLVENLKASCLLMDGDSYGTVKMHDFIHSVATSIAESDKLMFNIQNVTGSLNEMLGGKSKNSTAISLPSGVIDDELPEKLEFPKLELFLVYARFIFTNSRPVF
ncbi:disease resistance protein At4g27190-like [Pistacia vera]|uniref:disease resistance protein At4g27190-like n=1 Tax=Pistacia vera TaxID=55513 RepID=UPI001263767B|nr:disease resistance protein At4g27190-like [Pistacia vera]